MFLFVFLSTFYLDLELFSFLFFLKKNYFNFNSLLGLILQSLLYQNSHWDVAGILPE